ncbi:MAG TPA: branched-chain amino acid ABC transporter permease [Burkholderiales bacterium]|nr:branched-chain amino acid ABC transporter permease [Burkholderiales bacterium]
MPGLDGAAVIALSVLTSIAILLLTSLGLAVIFGLMRIVNMAHGEFLMIGAFTTTVLVQSAGLPVWLAILCAPLTCALVGAVVEVLFIRPLYGRRLVETLLATFGLSLILYQAAIDIFGQSSPGIGAPGGFIEIGRYTVSTYSLFLPVVALAIVALLYLLFKRTRYGLLARAAVQNPDMAAVLGVPVRRVNLLTFVLGCSLAGLGGGLISPIVAVSPGVGQSYVGQAFMTVVTGGPAFLLGSLASSALLGGVANVVSQMFTNLWGLSALLVVAILLVRLLPNGLSGGWTRGL